MLTEINMIISTGPAERKQQFLVITIGQDWMIEVSWRQDFTFDDADGIGFQVIEIFSDYGWVSKYLYHSTKLHIILKHKLPKWENSSFADPRVEAAYVQIVDPLAVLTKMVQFDGVGAPTKERLRWAYWAHNIDSFEKRFHLGVLLGITN